MEDNKNCVCGCAENNTPDKEIGVCPACEEKKTEDKKTEDFSFVERMQKEQDELDIKRVKLQEFIDSEKFKSLDEENQSLLCMQLNCMANYEMILERRLYLIRKKQNGK